MSARAAPSCLPGRGRGQSGAMRDLCARLSHLFRLGRPFALVMVVEVTGSSPSPVGQMMAVDESGRVHGSLSAGCIESEAYHRALKVLEAGGVEGRSCERFEWDGLDPLSAGLSCGGSLQLMVRLVRPGAEAALPAALAALECGEPFALVTALDGAVAGAQAVVRAGSVIGELRLGADDAAFSPEESVPASGGARYRMVRLADGPRVLVQWFDPPPQLLIFGVNAFTEPLRAQGMALGYRVTVCDARPVFAAAVPGAVVEWPHRALASVPLDERSAICSLTHDLRFEVPLLRAALRGPAGYVGALGSRRANEQRLRALRGAGCTESELARLRAPMGLDLGDPSPAATALAVAAELVQARTGRSGRPLSGLGGTIHDRRPRPAEHEPIRRIAVDSRRHATGAKA
ncbi:MAG TPA: XdhC family protein [Actinospica sp.]|nr:XdhC family protein [Actinospica sp.]